MIGIYYKQQNKIKPDKNKKTNETELTNLSDKAFKTVVIKMPTGLQLE